MNFYYLSSLSSLIYFLINIFYFKIIKKKNFYIKKYIKNSILIFILIIISYYIILNFTKLEIQEEVTPKVFLNNPDF